MNAFELATLAAHPDVFSTGGEIARAYLRAHRALEIINQHNHINNDLQAYLFDLAEWGMGKIDNEPLPETFGLTGGIE